MYNNGYIHNPYNNAGFHNQLPALPHQYYPQYPTIPQNPYPYVRSPPPQMQHYAHPPMPPQPYTPRPPPQASPVVVSTFKPVQTQSTSTQSSHTVPMTPPTPQTVSSVAPPTPVETSPPRNPFRAPLPWLSRPDLPWPARRARRKRKQNLGVSAEPVVFEGSAANGQPGVSDEAEAAPTTEQTPIRPETPSTNQPQSEEAHSTNPTTPSSVTQAPVTPNGDTTPVAPKHAQKPAIPAVPLVSAVSKGVPQDSAPQSVAKSAGGDSPKVSAQVEDQDAGKDSVEEEKATTDDTPAPAPVAWAKPKLWAGLFNPSAPRANASKNEKGSTTDQNDSKANTESLADALRSFSVESNDSKIAFLKPRGLVNTGNMCYMNSVLQVLVSCVPFYSFLDQVGKRAAHSFKSDTPLIDAMIMFMREYPVIDSAVSVEKLRMRLKQGELEDYGEAFIPEFVYDVTKHLTRFSAMRRGHQQDAQEFLNLLFMELHEECERIMRASTSNSASAIATPKNNPASPTEDAPSANENGWLEVGRKQKASTTQSSGIIAIPSPITNIFGGKLRTEVRRPGQTDSVTITHFETLQLDIGAPNVNNIVEALKGLSRSEILETSAGRGAKQDFLDSLPSVLILHLKRFQYDEKTNATSKIWKKVGYPLDLEIPKEVFTRQKRGVYSHGGLPRYRLTAVVYHHGKNASGGHYTVDVRRQDGREWIRIDDTLVRRVRSEDVAEGGSEEDPKALAVALEAHKNEGSGNPFSAFDEEQDPAAEDGWKQASGPGKKWSSVVNGASTPKAKADKSSIKDNKVAYLLFYEKI
ncbi:Cysteine proteinase [Glarea lozoyensis ATCC 20868]|uniref:Ubiquitin carboxyl-terminal hydrolase n=1 Tax=Glarea lozoyensis (strain ATCC 20868 / MF5171) TaxID=1116229 RepID=S3DCA4_GLAL2|nr:Cysteine proteinase [Glarea lozoyensis ATCC 20868]EPE35345.1 Cysteine proteinase [Glarea lozoyensis ATCC 20868]